MIACVGLILDGARHVSPGTIDLLPRKDLWSARDSRQKPLLVTCEREEEQTSFVVRKILEHYEQGIPLRRQAVLFRVGHWSDHLEVELARRKIPFHKYGGLKFLEAAHVKAVLNRSFTDVPAMRDSISLRMSTSPRTM